MPSTKPSADIASGVRTGLLARLARDTSGNAMVIVAGATLPIMALIGGGVDMSRGYLTETRLQQACDAGVLAARKKLADNAPSGGVVPAVVADTGNRFFNINFRNGVYGTVNRSFVMTLESDFSISGEATVDVPTTIMKLFGFAKLPVIAKCTAKLNFNDTDIMMVLDTTQSMEAKAVSTDTYSKLVTMKNVIKSFHAQMEATKGSSIIRVRYGFVPYSTNVNVGALLQDDWVVDNWNYQSREIDRVETGAVTTTTYSENWVTLNSNYVRDLISTYDATYTPAATEANTAGYSCNGPALPANTYTANYVNIGAPVVVPYAGPPAGSKTTQKTQVTRNGIIWFTQLSGDKCQVYRDTFNNHIDEFDNVTIPYAPTTTFWNYAKLPRVVTGWRAETNDCMEERETYEITDYNNIDFTKALDLDIRMVPTADPKTQWRPMYPNEIYIRNMDGYGAGPFSFPPMISDRYWMYQPGQISNMIACPTESRKLAELPMTSGANATLDSYLGSITAAGTTYHDIGMLWGGRLLTQFGLFAAENTDASPGKPLTRHLIFLTDGQTEPYDIAYGAYGIEPLDRRRWNKETPALGLTLPQLVEKRFGVACDQVKKDNITVWVVGFGTTVTQVMKDCSGAGRWFQANNAADLNNAFARIANSMGDLRISK